MGRVPKVNRIRLTMRSNPALKQMSLHSYFDHALPTLCSGRAAA